MNGNLFYRIVRTGLILACLQVSLNLMAEDRPSTCSNATLKGTYTFLVQGSIVGANGTLIPIQVAGVEVFDGNGKAHGISTAALIVNGRTIIQSNVPYTSTYTVSADCTGKAVDTDANGNVFHFDEFIGPDGNHLTFTQTDPGVVSAGTETRDSEK